jgi:signal transduction histidine kinase
MKNAIAIAQTDRTGVVGMDVSCGPRSVHCRTTAGGKTAGGILAQRMASDETSAGTALPARPAAPGTWKTALLFAAVAAVSVCHYLTPPAYVHWHIVYQRLYYLPILFGAFWYGLRGGLGIAVVTSVAYLPHIILHWGHEPLYRSNQLAEILLFLVIGAVAGILSDRLRREREKQQRTAEELQRAYEQLQSTFERLRLVDRLSALGALSAGMAHEIKNPLGSILGSIEILESAVAEGDEKREFVAILKKEIERLSHIVSNHLDFVRTSTPERRAEDVVEIVRSVAELTTKQAEKQGVRITLDAPPALPPVWADDRQIRQALLNLVINAIQALPGGGEVRIRVGVEGARVHVVVEDDGPGFDDEARRRALEPFYTTKDGGTGLGLSIAFQIADQHGGDLKIGDRDGGGARLRLELPTAPDVVEERAPAPEDGS